eukprot:jgi/Galph1/212/GphlegSOOS_G4981.1
MSEKDKVEKELLPGKVYCKQRANKNPFDPLNAEEILLAKEICQKYPKFPSSLYRFISIDLKEPEKQAVLTSKENGVNTVAREATACLLDHSNETTFEIQIDLDMGRVKTWKKVPQVQPRITADELVAVEKLVKEDKRVQQILRDHYKLHDMELIIADGWGIGNEGEPFEKNIRLVQVFFWCRMSAKDDNLYAHPIEGFVPLVDLNKMQIVEYKMYTNMVMPVPPDKYPYSAKIIGMDKLRKDIRRIEIRQPEGISFHVNGNEVSWQKWKFHIGFNTREALVLRDISYKDGDEERSILYRASLAEMVVPYGDPRAPHNRKIAFDVGEYGLGFCCNSLNLGCDCLGTIYYFDGYVNNSRGDPVKIENAICLHEEDDGMLWKHTDTRAGSVEVRRSRRLVVSCVATFVNYDYGLYWYFYQDGKIEFKVKHTGQLFTSAWDEENWGLCPFGTLVAPKINAQYHQHFYCMRLDFDIDGTENYVSEVNVAPESLQNIQKFLSPGQKYTNNALKVEQKIFQTEQEAQRRINALTNRFWKVSSSYRKNKMGYPCAYKILPGNIAYPIALENSSLVQRAQFITNTLWVTSFEENEKYPAGDYPNQSLADTGLSVWTRQNRNIKDKDIVVWYCFGITHIPQCEDWPVMPVVEAGFALHPSGFFDLNPSNDVPPTSKQENCSEIAHCQATQNGRHHNSLVNGT